MISRRGLLAGAGGLVLAGGAYATGAYRSAMAAAEARLARRSSLVETSRVAPEEQRRAELILEGLMPISRKTDGLRTDGFWAGTPSPTTYGDIAVPTLILSCEDDLFGTAETARRLAERIPEASLTIWPEGGHIWLGHDADVASEIAEFVKAG